MKFAMLEEYEIPKPIKSQKSTSQKPVSSEKPKRKVPYERLKGIIDTVGQKLARDENLSIEEKKQQWVDLLLWVLPHIPDDEQHMKAKLTEAINNPSEWDFIEKQKGSRNV